MFEKKVVFVKFYDTVVGLKSYFPVDYIYIFSYTSVFGRSQHYKSIILYCLEHDLDTVALPEQSELCLIQSWKIIHSGTFKSKALKNSDPSFAS